MLDRRLTLAVLVVYLLPVMPALGQDNDENRTLYSFDIRARMESVDQDNPLLDADATTIRARIGLTTPRWRNLDLFGEIEAIGRIGAEKYNSGSNGRTQFSLIPDHDDVEINQFVVRYRNAHHYLQIGRQRMPLDNQRFFGDVGYRQNQQTYDAISYMNTAREGQQFRYAYMARARRFLSDEHPLGEIDMNAHIVNFRLQRLNGDTFSAYAYLIDMDKPEVAQNSHKVLGVRYNGAHPTGAGDLLYELEYANQSDYADGAPVIDADYVAAELGWKFRNEWVAKIGQQRLGGDGRYAFQTPFASNHAFHGYADLFAARTPPNGVVDSYIRLVAPLWGARVQLAAHDFAADSGSADHGSEIDVRIEKRFAKRFAVSLLYADYDADNIAVDTTKWALWIDFRY